MPQLSATDAAGSGTRLGWLDVLRGLAALAVVFDHLSRYAPQHVRAIVCSWTDVGLYGVFVFFIVPAAPQPAMAGRSHPATK
jgi:peptidoglycan/LPS O-acetylase OafA/YrhL